MIARASTVGVASIASRLGDRLRPWSAARCARPDGARIAVIGAGPAGLATAALLQRHGACVTVFDRSERIGSSWAGRYDSLRLNTVRWMSDLPGLRMGRSLGRWVHRDDVVGYLERYAAHHRLECVLGPDGAVDRVAPNGRRWQLGVGDDGAEGLDVDAVVMATGHSRVGVLPTWALDDRWRAPRLIHAAAYRRPGPYLGRRVLVVGAGSSGGEICVDLAGAGLDVTWSVRGAPQVFPREVLGVPATPFAPPADLLPDAALDRAAPWVERRLYGERDYLPEPTAPVTQLLERCKEPMTADGIVGLIRAGRVRVVEAVEQLDDDGAVLVDGSRVDVDHVIAATGYRTGLETLLGDLDVLDPDGRPAALVPKPGLGFVGFRIPLTGTLWAIEQDARRVADAFRDVRPQGFEP